MGGTFDIIHRGHRILLEEAYNHSDELFIGLTSDILARKDRDSRIKSFEERKRNLEEFLSGLDGKPYHIIEIEDKYGVAHTGDFDAIVVSGETYETAKEINEYRKKIDLKSIEIINIGTVYAQDFIPMSSTRIRSGEIDEDGRALKPLRICVGSTNPVKINAVKNVLSGIVEGTGFQISVEGKDVELNVPKQPFEKDTVNGAIERAKGAAEVEGADIGIGIEAGLFFNEHLDKYLDAQYCAVMDRTGKLTLGHGSGFSYPERVIAEVERGKSIGEAMERIYRKKDLGKKIGAIGHLSGGRLSRTELTEQAVFMALLPRMDYYR